MKLVAPIKLTPTPEEAATLRATLARCNEACTWLATHGLSAGKTRQYNLHKLAYADLRRKFGLAAQVAVRCIAKVADAFKVSRKTAPRFRRDAAQPYDDRIFRFTGDGSLSIWTLEGRIKVGFTTGERQKALLAYRRGEADLALIRGKWFMICTCDIPETETFDPEDWLGIDLGIVNLAADSDGENWGGATVELVRRIFAHRRRNLQRNGTRAARRKLNCLKGKQARFQAATNHAISKAIVQKAQRTGRGIALEDLKGIRGRVTARRRQRARMANWGFHQLGGFVRYKAALMGVPVLMVDPRDTSRRCSCCGTVDKASRRSRDQFVCISCGHAAPADTNAAVNIRSRARADVMRPMLTQAA